MEIKKAKEVLDKYNIDYTHRVFETQYNKVKMKYPESFQSFLFRSMICFSIHFLSDGFFSWCDFLGKRVDILWLRKDERVVLININEKDGKIFVEHKFLGEKKWRTSEIKNVFESFEFVKEFSEIF